MRDRHWTETPREGWPRGLRQWMELTFRNSSLANEHNNFLSQDLARFVWSAFCIQWVTIAWAMLVGQP